MTSPPTKEQLISLVESMCKVQGRMLSARGMPVSKDLTCNIPCPF